MSPDRLIYMANQIGKFFHSQGHDKAVPGIAEHIRKFWDPRMRSAIFAHLDAGGAGLDPDVRDAVEALKKTGVRDVPSAFDKIAEHATGFCRRMHALLQRSERGLSAPADPINRAATIHRCSWPYSNPRAPTPGVTKLARPTAAALHLFQTDRYPAHCSRHFSADLWTAELQDHAIGILQLNASSPCRNRTAGSDRAVSAFNRSRATQIEGPSDQLGCRGSDREADAHARCGEWIALASEGQHALAAADPDDESAFREHDGNLTGFGPRGRAETSYACEQGNQGDVYAELFHDFFL
jgi:formate dehydrogenase subunit delta